MSCWLQQVAPGGVSLLRSAPSFRGFLMDTLGVVISRTNIAKLEMPFHQLWRSSWRELF